MIHISDKRYCCGCAACVQICPKHCILFNEDERGFCYPQVEKDLCISCGLCEKVCPYLNTGDPSIPIKVVSAINPNEEIRMKSSSGGIFTMLAVNTLNESGVVFGSCFDKSWEVKHKFIESVDEINVFRGAKYSQSVIGNTFKEVKSFLDQGRKVLFSGTGCQIAGLRLSLRKVYENLLTVEIACHGVPSPRVWREYLDFVTNGERARIKFISFRDKRNGWNNYGIDITTTEGTFYECASNNLYMQCFLRDLSLRPSCTNCPAKRGASGSDIIIGDFWGVESLRPEIFDNKGCSLIIVNTHRGLDFINRLNIKRTELSYEESYRYNPCLIQSSIESRYTSLFWNNFQKKGISGCKTSIEFLKSRKLLRILTLIYSKLFM